MAIDTIKSTAVLDGAIATADIADANITTAKIADDAVTTDKLANAINTDIAAKLPLAGGTMTGVIAGFESTGIDDNATSTAITIGSDENVGIGLANPSDYYAKNLVVAGPSEGGITIAATGNHTNYINFADSTSGVARYAGMIEYAHSIDQMVFRTNSLERI